MSKKINLILLFIFLAIKIQSQPKVPAVKGHVLISIKNGTMDCEIEVSNLPEVKNYVFRLNTGMNIYNIKDSSGTLLYSQKSKTDTLTYGETMAYYFIPDYGQPKFLPKHVKFKYTGKFPVISENLKEGNFMDSRGEIAFNGSSVRADARQGCWYPILYDAEKDKLFDNVTYDINLKCVDCNALYVNGSAPVKKNAANFKSSTPRGISLFCGNYNFSKKDNIYILNSGLNQKQETEMGHTLKQFKSFYEKKLKVSYKDDFYIIQTTPTDRNEWSNLWVEFPSIYNVGRGKKRDLTGFFDAEYGSMFKSFIGHEMGHYYFYNLLNGNSIIGRTINEGFTEFIAMELSKEILKDSVYEKKLTDITNTLKDKEIVPIAKLKTLKDFGNKDDYDYKYMPLILTAIKKDIGDDPTWAWLNKMLTTKTDFSDYNFLLKTLKDTINNDEKINLLKSKYFESEKSILNAIERIVK